MGTLLHSTLAVMKVEPMRAALMVSCVMFQMVSADLANAAPQPPFPAGRWVSTSGADIGSAAQRTKICKQQRAWMDVSATEIAFGGVATDAQSCQAPQWRKINAKTFVGTPRKCTPELDSLGDPAGPLQIVIVGADTMSLNNSIFILCAQD